MNQPRERVMRRVYSRVRVITLATLWARHSRIYIQKAGQLPCRPAPLSH